MIFRVDNVDGNEGRLPRWLHRRWIVLLLMFFDPRIDGVDGATDVTGDLGDGEMGVEYQTDGLLLDVVGVTNARH